MSEDIEILLRIAGKFYEGKLHPQRLDQRPQVSDNKNAPIFPEPFAEMLTISDQGSYWQIKPKAFLNTGDFSEILRIIKQYSGEYVSAGKSSHFRVPK
jgi:hypothetical protein